MKSINRLSISFLLILQLVFNFAFQLSFPTDVSAKALTTTDRVKENSKEILARTITFKITINEPPSGFVTSITVCVKERSNGNPINVSGWTNGCRTVNGSRLNETMQVPDTIKVWLVPTITIKNTDTIRSSYEFTGGDIDFRDPKSPFNSSALVVCEYSVVNLEITSVEQPHGRRTNADAVSAAFDRRNTRRFRQNPERSFRCATKTSRSQKHRVFCRRRA